MVCTASRPQLNKPDKTGSKSARATPLQHSTRHLRGEDELFSGNIYVHHPHEYTSHAAFFVRVGDTPSKCELRSIRTAPPRKRTAVTPRHNAAIDPWLPQSNCPPLHARIGVEELIPPYRRCFWYSLLLTRVYAGMDTCEF